MAKLDDTLVSEFVAATMPEKETGNKEFTINGTVMSVDSSGTVNVTLDGGSDSTPCETTVNCVAGDRVIVSFKNRNPVVTSNLTKPVATVYQLDAEIANIGQIYAKTATVNALLADYVKTAYLTTNYLTANSIKTTYATISTLDADVANLNTLISKKITAGGIITGTLQAVDGTFKGTLRAANGSFTGSLMIERTIEGYGTYHIYVGYPDVGIPIYVYGLSGHGGETLIEPGSITLRSDSKEYTINGSSSDRRLKEAITDINPQESLKLRPVKFRFKGERPTRYGLIAQDVQEVFPDAVTEGKNGYLLLNYQDIIAPTLALAQHNNKLIESLIKRIDELERKVEALEAKCNQVLSDKE